MAHNVWSIVYESYEMGNHIDLIDLKNYNSFTNPKRLNELLILKDLN